MKRQPTPEQRALAKASQWNNDLAAIERVLNERDLREGDCSIACRIAAMQAQRDAAITERNLLMDALCGLSDAYGDAACECCNPHVPEHCPHCKARAIIGQCATERGAQ